MRPKYRVKYSDPENPWDDFGEEDFVHKKDSDRERKRLKALGAHVEVVRLNH